MEIGTVIFTKIGSKGAAIEIKLHAVGGGSAMFRAFVDGVAAGQCDNETYILDKRQDLYGFGYRPTIGLTGAERAELDAIMAGVTAEARVAYAATPEGQAAQLRQQRRDLVSAVTAAHDVEDSRFSRAHDRQDATAWTGKAAGEATIAAARAALAAFDAAHPEIVRRIQDERATESAQGFLARGLD